MCKDLMFISISRFKPRMRDSYLNMLLVQLKSIPYEKRVASLSSDIKTTQMHESELECAPSNYKPQSPSFLSSS
jgi:hypothetical protein